MRWERLFDDLEARLAASERAELRAEVEERTVAERAGVELASRLAAHRGRAIAVVLAGGARVGGTLRSVAADGILVDVDGSEALIPSSAVALVEGLERRASVRTVVEARLRITSVLRALAERGVRVVVETDGGTFAGTLAEVGADHLDLDGDGPRRTVALGSLRMLRSAPERPY